MEYYREEWCKPSELIKALEEGKTLRAIIDIDDDGDNHYIELFSNVSKITGRVNWGGKYIQLPDSSVFDRAGILLSVLDHPSLWEIVEKTQESK